MRKSTESIKSGADKILKRVQLARDGIGDQIGKLRKLMADLKTAVETTDG